MSSQAARELEHGFDARIANAPFDAAEVRPVEVRFLGKLVLGEAAFCADARNVAAKRGEG